MVRMEGARVAAYMKKLASGSSDVVRSMNGLSLTEVKNGTPIKTNFSTASDSLTGGDVLK